MKSDLLKQLLLCYLLASGIAITHADVITHYEKDQTRTDQKPQALQDQPDTTGLWYHINEHQKILANKEFERLKARYPDWQPSADLVSALARLNTPPKTLQPTPPKQPVANKPAPAKPAKQVIRKPSQAQQIMDRIAQGKKPLWRSLPDDDVSKAATLALQDSKGRYLQLMGWVYIARANNSQALRFFTLAGNKFARTASIKDGQQAALSGLVKQRAQQNDEAGLTHLIKHYPEFDIPKLIDGEAWQAFNQRHYLKAQNLFSLTGNTYGEILALDKQGKKEQAEHKACTHLDQTSVANYCYDALSAKQSKYFDAKAYQNSINVADQLKQHRKLTESEQVLYAWAQYHLQHKQQAIPAFSRLLQTHPSNQSYANALVTLSANDPAQLQHFAKLFPTVNKLVRQRKGEQAWYRKQFDLAYFYGYPPSLATEDRDKLELFTGMDKRKRSGDSGLGKLNTWDSYIGMSDTWHQWRWQAQLDYQNYDSGTPAKYSWFGKRQLINDFHGISKVNGTGLRFALGRQYDDLNLHLDLDYSLLNQPVNTDLTGQLAATWFFNKAQASVSLFHEHKTDSLLSTTGTYTADHQQTWGGVFKSGIRGLGVYSFAKNWSLATTVDLEQLTGQQVANNNMQAVRVDVDRDFKDDINYPLDHLRIGPFVSWESYDKNLSDYTIGHGGYFSPSRFVTVGGFLDLLTAEGRKWQVHTALSLGYAQIQQDSYWRFPLNPNGNRVGATSSQGMTTNLAIEGQWRFATHWSVAGYVQQVQSIEYQSTDIGVQLRWYFGKGKGLTSDQLILSTPRQRGFAL